MLINLLVYLLVGIVVVSIVYWLLGEIISDPKLLKIARVIVAVIVLIFIIYLIFPYFGSGSVGHPLIRNP